MGGPGIDHRNPERASRSVNAALWLFLLLPIAFATGWYVGGKGSVRRSGQRVSRLSTTYFRGLNYLLNEQPDKAIELFLQIAEVDQNTVETQIALGHLFRRRGEVDRAIRLHQSLIARPGLDEDYKKQALLELGEDYMRAGLLDRAETLFTDLVRLDVSQPQALKHLISIYQAEREWDKAIAHAERYQATTGTAMGRIIAQFHCELAEQARIEGDKQRCRREIAAAFAADTHSVRAGMLEGQLEAADGNDLAAIRAFERVARHDIEYLPEVLKPLLPCYQRRGEPGRARAFLAEMIEHYPGVAPALALAKLIEEEEGRDAAVGFLSRQLQQRPSIRGQAALIELSLAKGVSDQAATLRALQQVTEQMLVRSPAYRCQHCGFGARAHHWQCPSCKSWGTVKPAHTLSGD